MATWRRKKISAVTPQHLAVVANVAAAEKKNSSSSGKKGEEEEDTKATAAAAATVGGGAASRTIGQTWTYIWARAISLQIGKRIYTYKDDEKGMEWLA